MLSSKVASRVFLHQGGDLIQCSIPGDVFPCIRPSTTHPRRGQAPRTGRRRAFARGVVAARAIATIATGAVLGRPFGRLPQVGQRLSAQAEPPFRERIRAVAAHRRHPPVLHIEHQRAGARTLLADDDGPAGAAGSSAGASSVPAASSAASSSAQARFGSKPHAALPTATAPAPARKPLRVNFMDERLLRTGPRPASASLFTPCLLEPSFSHKRPSCARSKTPSARRRRDA